MHFKHFRWTIEKLNTLRGQIDPKPQYQRGDAWDDKSRSLLIDSIISGFDVPKLYLRYSKGTGSFDYEVADGQQRLKSIWQFLDGNLILTGMSAANASFNGKTFATLAEADQRRALDFVIVTTVVYNATNDQTRELFRRLQLGIRLNPAELRNSMASALGNEVRAMALTHPFFPGSPFSLARYKADDLVAHAFAIVLYKRQRDIKAPDLKEMYLACAERVDASISKTVNAILHFLDDMQQSIENCVATKWGLVDLVGVLATRKLHTLSPTKIAEAYVEWEYERASYSGRLAELASSKVGSRQRKLYDYISAFQKEGATKKNLSIRFAVLDSILPE